MGRKGMIDVDLSTKFSENIVNTNYENLDEETIIAAKQAIMDTLGVMLAGTGAGESIDEVLSFVDDMGGTDDCTIIGQDKRSNVMLAALANGSVAHSIDYDNAHDDAFVHPSGSVVPTALTVGEYVKASGKDVLTAVALGDDLICRLGFAVSNPPENKGDQWMLPVLVGTFSATATAAKLFNLDLEGCENAFGIAYNRAGGSKQLVNESGALRGLYCMFPNMTGTMAARLAKNGVPGLKEPFNGAAGFFNMYYKGIYDETAFDGMGTHFEGTGVSIKPWPCCRFTNSHVDAALNIARENEIDPAKIAKITLYYESPQVERCLFPEDDRKNPPTIPGAKLSLPFVVACALVRNKVEIGDFSAESISDPVLLDLCAKTVYERDESLHSEASKTMMPGRVAVEMEDGTVYDKRVDFVYGHPKNRMEWPDLLAKFKDCVGYARRKFTDEEMEKISNTIEHLEDLDDISELLALVK